LELLHMKEPSQQARAPFSPSDMARQRMLSAPGEPLFHADWVRSVFIHYEVEPSVLQQAIPFPLDVRDGKAYVSLVAFTIRHLRPRFGGKFGELVLRPIAHHGFLNVRAYVLCNGEPGIYFLSEWLSNRWAVPLGPPIFGLPYRLGKLNYHHTHERNCVRGEVVVCDARLAYEGGLPTGINFEPCREGTLDEFLLERYTAFTRRGTKSRFFRIWHPPWLQAPLDVDVREDRLLTENWPWFTAAKLLGGNYSPGVFAWMGRPHTLLPAAIPTISA
jgi:uncharacterized protein